MNNKMILVGAGLGLAAYLFLRRKEPGVSAGAPQGTRPIDGQAVAAGAGFRAAPAGVGPGAGQSAAVVDQRAGADLASRPAAPVTGAFTAAAFLPIRRTSAGIAAYETTRPTGAPRQQAAAPDTQGYADAGRPSGPSGGIGVTI